MFIKNIMIKAMFPLCPFCRFQYKILHLNVKRSRQLKWQEIVSMSTATSVQVAASKVLRVLKPGCFM